MIYRVYVVMEQRYEADGFTVEESSAVRAFSSESGAMTYIDGLQRKRGEYSYRYHYWIEDIPYDD